MLNLEHTQRTKNKKLNDPTNGKFFNVIEGLAKDGKVDLDRSW